MSATDFACAEVKATSKSAIPNDSKILGCLCFRMVRKYTDTCSNRKFHIIIRRRVCRCGAGQEQTINHADTPGFPLQEHASVVCERQRCQKLRLPRNHSRLNQSSTALLQTWRANCDVQIMIYDSCPEKFDLQEVSKVTDYVVAYSCKGNATLREEIETNKRLILGMEETTGDISELQSVCKRVINRTSASRLISKQEASVLLANMDLYTCSDNIELVSISNNTRLTVSEGGGKTSNILQDYANRPSMYRELSLHEFFPIYRGMRNAKGTTKTSVPHYTGVAGFPTFPVTESYARHVLIVYKPWTTYPDQPSWKMDFDNFIRSKRCPTSCRLHYDRVMQRYYQGTMFVEPTAKETNYNLNLISQEDTETLLLAGLGSHEGELAGQLDFNCIQKGVGFQWDRPPLVSTLSIIHIEFIERLEKNLKQDCQRTHIKFFERFEKNKHRIVDLSIQIKFLPKNGYKQKST
jgi:hypothetical protein